MIEELHEIEKKTLIEHYNRLLRINHQFKYLQLKFVWSYLHESDLFKPICDMFLNKEDNLVGNAMSIADYGQATPLPDKYIDRVYLSYLIVKQILQANNSVSKMSIIGKNYSSDKALSDDEYFKLFNDLFLEPLIYFFLNQANRHFLILGLLKKYKHRTEWFNKEFLYEKIISNTNKSEEILKSDLYKYFFDMGLDFFIEPTSPSGKIDFIGSQKKSANKILAEGKIFDGNSRGKSYIIKGVWQVLTYIKENNEKEGYLVVFSNSNKVISFNFQTSEYFPFHIIDNKKIYFIVIDLYQYETTASKRGGQEIIEINKNDFENKHA